MQDPQSKTLVLVTGISGFLGAEVAFQLLDLGYKVRGTVRSLKNEIKVKPIRELHPSCPQNLELMEADLEKEEGWSDVVKGVDYILHLASPLPFKPPSKRDALVAPAVNGTLNVLRVADKEPSVKGVVVTSSALVFFEGKPLSPGQNVFNEDELGSDKDVQAYSLSKFRSMAAAWEFYNEKERTFKMAMIHPTLMIGPPKIEALNASSTLVIYFLSGKVPSCPAIQMPAIDVRDSAKLHILAMENIDVTEGQSYIANDRSLSFLEIGITLSDQFSKYGYKIPTQEMSNCMFKMASLFDKGMRQYQPIYRKKFHMDNEKIGKALPVGEYTPLRRSLVEMSYQLIKKGHVPDKLK